MSKKVTKWYFENSKKSLCRLATVQIFYRNEVSPKYVKPTCTGVGLFLCLFFKLLYMQSFS